MPSPSEPRSLPSTQAPASPAAQHPSGSICSHYDTEGVTEQLLDARILPNGSFIETLLIEKLSLPIDFVIEITVGAIL